MRKEEIACNKQFLLFSQCFLPFVLLVFHFKCTLKCRLQFISIWTSLKFCRLVMGYDIVFLVFFWLPPLIFRWCKLKILKFICLFASHFYTFKFVLEILVWLYFKKTKRDCCWYSVIVLFINTVIFQSHRHFDNISSITEDIYYILWQFFPYQMHNPYN